MKYYIPDKSKNIYCSADFHGFHKNYCSGVSGWSNISICRQFSDQYIMTQTIVDNINSIVKSDDILYVLGDWSFGGKDNIQKFRDMIDCETIILVLGNHDSHIRNDAELQKLFTHVSSYEEFQYKKQLICCSHYPLGSWNRIGKDGINIFGHCHSTYKRCLSRQMDVGLDTNDLKPYLLDDIINRCLSRPIDLPDHHNENTSYY